MFSHVTADHRLSLTAVKGTEAQLPQGKKLQENLETFLHFGVVCSYNVVLSYILDTFFCLISCLVVILCGHFRTVR